MSERFHIIKITREQWSEISESVHRVVFNEERPKSMDRIDYVLLIEDAEGKPSLYCTVRELDEESIYWQYGGSFPGTYATPRAVEGYRSLIDWAKQRYRRITNLVENSNVRYLKLAMHFGFRIIGCRTFEQKVYVELLNDFREEN